MIVRDLSVPGLGRGLRVTGSVPCGALSGGLRER